MLTANLIEVLKNASAKALATTGPHGINVVPISVIEVSEQEILLFDFFMNKTAENLQVSKTAALTAWSGLTGIQVKAKAAYEKEGERFLSSVVVMKERFPDRVLRGVIVLQPTHIYNVSAGAESGRLLKSSADF